MTQWTLAHIEELFGSPEGDFEPGQILSEISTDSRTLKKGSLFVPLVGDNFDGHDYAEMAIREKGASACLWSRDEVPNWLAESAVVFRVADTLEAYQALGLKWKKICGVRCIGITGSVGKTTTKEMMAHTLGAHFKVHKSKANYNNDIGVPKTLLELRPEHEVAIVEMGMRGRGQIARLVRAADPEIGVITGIGTSHLELLGSREEIARAKGELVEGLSSAGAAVLPASDDFYELLKELSAAPVTTFSAKVGSGADFCPQEVLAEDAHQTTFRRAGSDHVLPLPGEHHLHDFMAVLAVAKLLGIEEKNALANSAKMSGPQDRAEWHSVGGAKVYLDCYNSAPESLKASLGVLHACQGRRIAVLGDMLELGETGPAVHREIGTLLPSFEVDLALCFGPLSKGIVEAAQETGIKALWFQEKQALADCLLQELNQGDCVLVKASRGMALETVIGSIKEKVG